MSASVSTERKDAFVLKHEQVKRIWKVFNLEFGSPTIIIRCSDEISREYENWKSFSSYENSPNKSIKRLIIKARSKDYSKRAKVEFSDEKYRIVDIDIDGSETVVTNLYDDISDILDGTKPWYSRLTKIDFFYVIGFVFWAGFTCFDTDESPEKVTTTKQAIAATTIAGLLFAVLAVIWGLNKLRHRIFPIAYFAIGQGLQRYELDEKIRWGVIVAFVISISSSTVFALFQ
ncbi:hypothetical protein [Alishewanella longhuensis]